MVKRLFIALAIGCVIGCDPAPETKPAESKPAAPKATTSSTAEKPTTSAPVGNPNRIFQLDKLAKTDVKAAGHTYHCWIMDTDSKRQEGMMFLEDKDVKSDEGMVFVFSSDESPDHGFWMHNTLVPLDIIYITSDKKVAFIAKGEKENDTSLKPGKAYRYVVELKQGTAAANGISVGTAIDIPGDVKAAD